MLMLRAIAAFLVLPTMVAGVIPTFIAVLDPWRFFTLDIGYAIGAIGLFLLIWCVRDFYVQGQGTLAPWDPPKYLVAVGLYKHTRNPMYVAVVSILIGWVSATGSTVLIAYTICVAVAFHLRVVFHEEPSLAQKFGEEWARYKAKVPRWTFHIHAYNPDE